MLLLASDLLPTIFAHVPAEELLYIRLVAKSWNLHILHLFSQVRECFCNCEKYKTKNLLFALCWYDGCFFQLCRYKNLSKLVIQRLKGSYLQLVTTKHDALQQVVIICDEQTPIEFGFCKQFADLKSIVLVQCKITQDTATTIKSSTSAKVIMYACQYEQNADHSMAVEANFSNPAFVNMLAQEYHCSYFSLPYIQWNASEQALLFECLGKYSRTGKPEDRGKCYYELKNAGTIQLGILHRVFTLCDILQFAEKNLKQEYHYVVPNCPITQSSLLSIVQLAVKQGFSLLDRDETGNTALHIAVTLDCLVW